ncbi:MAG: MBL fold metallo-hydrolase [Bacteroidota bacterium]|nr:MBL fold metallo-hydrolase [Bacteroidota bacterium]
MKRIFLAFAILLFVSCKVLHKNATDLNKIQWIHGSNNCKQNTDPPIQIVKYNSATWILRQNKCVNYEAPFLFLFLGYKKALLMDTGATENENQFPLYETIKKLINEWEKTLNTQMELIVAHTHNHSDHTAGDIQFKNKPNTTIVGPGVDDVKAYFKLDNWPLQNSKIDLGNRVIEIIPIPGHEEASIAVYDYETKILLPGDSFYPGRLYIKDWPSYKLSIQRLIDFTDGHKISYILGNHIEMTKNSGKDYPVGTTFQPEEQKLPLNIKDLQLLNKALKRLGDNPTKVIHDNFIIYPK